MLYELILVLCAIYTFFLLAMCYVPKNGLCYVLFKNPKGASLVLRQEKAVARSAFTRLSYGLLSKVEYSAGSSRSKNDLIHNVSSSLFKYIFVLCFKNKNT